MHKSRGFTLIEMMIVVSIIAILASIAITVYNRSIGKAQLSEAFTTVDALKTDVADYQQQTGSCPSAGVGGLESPASYGGKYVASATVTGDTGNCVITALMRSNTVSPELRSKKVTFTMVRTGGNAKWSCSSDAPLVYLPQSCH